MKKGIFYLVFTLVSSLYAVGAINMDTLEFVDDGSGTLIASYQGKPFNGVAEAYNINNAVELRANFKDGKQDGILEVFDSNGKLITKEIFVDGSLKTKYDYKDGQLISTEEY